MQGALAGGLLAGRGLKRRCDRWLQSSLPRCWLHRIVSIIVLCAAL
jgi:hypothetical protein